MRSLSGKRRSEPGMGELEAATRSSNLALERAIRRLLAAHPVFRSKPVGGIGSIARAEQLEAIDAEDALLKLLNSK
jgi:hypothetical protein